ncbi:ArsR/SmtB family transcription factor [Spiroplasma diminutum]|uniref:ArsR family transcriptional regulator n=1 Tax=Spiroplasma diminutum CUAS-1 TaxID=1276221 RepID=S5M2J4_9MOLU|nr:metalloregulator ArsR/SmtB family transcription factor [Spiroplasma diminutum]AGR42307.1 ArsR family transcriptional regulator [Spiroplasma diminutum CUAS-1]
MKENYTKFAEIFKVLGDPTRLQIINMICDCGCNKCAQNILDNLNITQPTLSYHMKLLEKVGLINSIKDKNSKIYKVNREMVNSLKSFVSDLQVEKNLMTCSNCNNKK